METSKPDLMSASPHASAGKRILAQLEHGPRAPATVVRAAGGSIDGWTISLCVLLVLMCGVAWLMHEQRITPETFRPGATYTTGRGAAAPARAARMDHQPADEQAAAIVNEAGAAGDTATPSAHAVPAVQDIVRGSTKEGDATATTATPTALTAAIANAAAQTPSRAAPTKPAPTRAPAATPPAQATSDTDVTLLTALVAHSGKPTSVTPERSRDIVERQDGDSTAQLLARCKQLGLIEGMLCRSRICSGRWEADAACRAPAHGTP